MSRYPYIYLPEHIHNHFLKNELTFHDESIIIHETVHIHRQKKAGTALYFLKYIFSRKFRLNEELVAIREQMTFLKKHGQKYDFDRKAGQLASAEYLWVTSFKKARLMLEGLWSEV